MRIPVTPAVWSALAASFAMMALLHALPCHAQLAPAAPMRFSGAWETPFPRHNGTWSLQVDTLDADRFSGKMTFHGPTCVEVDLPVSGTWTADELYFFAKMNPIRCGDRGFRLRPGSRHTLEGQLEGGPITPWNVWLNRR